MALSKEWYDAEFVDSESESLHRAPSIEYSFYNAVKTGDMEYVIKNCKEDAFIHLDGTGVLSRNTLQNIKYHFVVTTAMITRYCIDGGLEPEQAYRLSDFYILKMDSCSPYARLLTCITRWQRISQVRWCCRRNRLSSQSLLPSVLTIYTAT